MVGFLVRAAFEVSWGKQTTEIKNFVQAFGTPDAHGPSFSLIPAPKNKPEPEPNEQKKKMGTTWHRQNGLRSFERRPEDALGHTPLALGRAPRGRVRVARAAPPSPSRSACPWQRSVGSAGIGQRPR